MTTIITMVLSKDITRIPVQRRLSKQQAGTPIKKWKDKKNCEGKKARKKKTNESNVHASTES